MSPKSSEPDAVADPAPVAAVPPPAPAPSDEELKGSREQQAKRKDLQSQFQALKERSQAPSFVPAESEEAKGISEELKALDAEIRAELEAASQPQK